MKKVLAMAVVLTAFASTAQATCYDKDCATLGYSKTEADCAGKKMIRCPFDNTQVMCVSELEAGDSNTVGSVTDPNAECQSSACEDYGYTRTVEECADYNVVVRCPFDLTKAACFSSKNCSDGGYSTLCDEENYHCEPVTFAGLSCYKLTRKTCEEKGLRTCGSGCITEAQCCYGDYYFSDGSCGAKADGKTPVGVIYSSDGNHGLVAALQQSSLIWSNEQITITKDMCPDTAVNPSQWSGKTGTACLTYLNDSEAAGNYPAAAYCSAYRTDGTYAGEWFLPNLAELQLMGANNVDAFAKVRAAITAVGGTDISETSYYWSSTQYGNGAAWRVQLGSGAVSSNLKPNSMAVRCALAF